jgi:hypothetical protein
MYHNKINYRIYITYIPFTQGSRKIILKNLPPGLQGTVAVIKSKASKWNEEEYIVFTMKCSYNMTFKKKRALWP